MFSKNKMLWRVAKYLEYSIDTVIAPKVIPSETVIISGFWRSGTTWLQESLARVMEAKTIFEPFSPKSGRFIDAMTNAFPKLEGRPLSFWLLFNPYVTESQLGSERLLSNYIDQVMTGSVPGKYHRYVRKRFWEAFSQKVVVKTVQGSLILKAIRDRYSNQLILLRRDPRGIIASLGSVPWFHMFRKLSLSEQFLGLGDGRSAHFYKYEAQFQTLDQQSPLARIAFYWAVQEKYLESIFANEATGVASVNYEDLVCRGEETMQYILTKIGARDFARPTPILLRTQSRNTRLYGNQTLKSPNERIFGWQHILSKGEIKTIERIVQGFGLEERFYSRAKKCESFAF